MIQLPTGWRRETLRDIAGDGVFQDGDWVESKDQDATGSVRLTQLADVGEGIFRDRSDRWLNDSQAKRLNVTFIEPGDLLIARMPDPLARCCQVPANIGPAVTVVDVAILRVARDDVDPRFVMWAINSPEFRAAALDLSSGTTRRRISRRNLGGLTIPLPPLDEQQRIVAILEAHLSRTDSALKSVAAAKKMVSALTRSFLNRLVPPLEDAQSTLGDLLREPMRNGHSALASASTTGIRTLTLTAVTRREFSDQYTKLTSADPGRVENLWLQPGDVLVERSNTAELVGCAAMYDGPTDWAIFPDLMIRLRPNLEVLLPEYLDLVLQSPAARSYLRSRAKGLAGSMPKIDQGTLSSMPFPAPSLEKQREMIEQSRAFFETVSRLGAATEFVESRSDALRRTALQCAFSGGMTKERSLV